MYTYNILIVEDDKQIADAIEIYMKNQNYGVFKAYNGQLAIEIFEKEVIHLIIMDVMMPVMDGFTAIMKIRQNSTVPIIVLSAKSEDMDKIAGLNIGADDYVTKPFNPMELIARVNSNLRRYVNFSMENENEISASGLLFKIQLPDSEQKIICNLDGKRTYRIFDNLISNILKYSLPSSRVYIDVSLNMNKVLIVF